ncbi:MULTISPECIES: hypothetical protein [unclassified Streptomyces]|uniref:hypothetical protein n=1 Tax=unclassified Streptomyces TaxID=2593676 RepID=UPI002ED1429F|nr:hypothetical protein OH827_33785 [Streptomyces sp. NBC_00891]WSY10067.1 hypothetical protein OG464_33790 [Streptomyces sp. NBC_00890]WSZ11799.1 hypothetical protein OG704_34395 [Streptomyces sp. NBC_00869]WSZ27795.1 hypothetical protein OG498_33790 [Streptomyces sp. NBC_00870]
MPKAPRPAPNFPALDLSAVLADRTGNPAAVPVPPGSPRIHPQRTGAPAQPRRMPPPVRNLPRRGGY